MQSLKNLKEGFISLFYPNLCLACGQNAPMPKQVVCTDCQYYLPKTNFHLEKENTFTDRLWGRFPLYTGAAFYHFIKKGRVQHLIHNLKYNNKPEVGYIIGLKYGEILKQAPLYRDIDVIIPVPLHPKKERQRGYNQSETFAKGLAESMEIKYAKNILIRSLATTTQTKKSRLERLENVSAAFQLKQPEVLRGKNVLIVDDVLTTGATLEACALKILEVPKVRVSLGTIGIAEN
ncbi:MAG: ComF family protein [Saprospiraceae bacterium]|jgi:ComF family protein